MKSITLDINNPLIIEIGAEYAGTYKVRILMSKEYLQITETLIQELRSEAQKKCEEWNGILPSTSITRGIVYASCTKDDKALPDDIPAKLFEVLACATRSMNMLSDLERQTLFQLFR